MGVNAGVGVGVHSTVGILGGVAGKVLPIIGTAVGGPVGAAVGKALGSIVANVSGGVSAGKSVSEAIAEGVTHSVGQSLGINAGYAHSWYRSDTVGDTTGTGTQHSDTRTDGTTDTDSTTKTTGTGRTLQIENQNKMVMEILKQLDKQLKRLKEGEDYGLSNCGAYFISSDEATSVLAANTYRALLVGEGSSVEKSAVNTWSNGDERTDAIKNYLKHFCQPVFVRQWDYDINVPTEISRIITKW